MEHVFDFHQMTQKVLEEAARNAVEAVLEDKLGLNYDSRSQVKEILGVEVQRLIREDPEVSKAIKDALMSWIAKQTMPEPSKGRY